MHEIEHQTMHHEPALHATTGADWIGSLAPHALYHSVPQFRARNSGVIALLAIIPLVLVQWFTTRAAIAIVWPLIPDSVKHFSWGFGYVGHLLQGLVACAIILLLRPWFPSSFGLNWPRGKSYLGPALIWGSLAGPLMLVVDYLPDLLAHHAPSGPYALGVHNVVPWLFMQGALVGPTEEIVFRGLFLGYLLCLYPRRIKLFGQEVSVAGIVIAVVFSLAHASSFWTTTLFAAIGQQVYVTALGIFYAWLFEQSGSLLAPALAHNAGDVIEWAACFALQGIWGHH